MGIQDLHYLLELWEGERERGREREGEREREREREVCIREHAEMGV